MSLARNERRAAERRAAKLVRKAAQKTIPSAVEPTPVASFTHSMDEAELDFKPAISEAKLAANRANAQQSTGPRTDAGKAVTRYNAVRNACTLLIEAWTFKTFSLDPAGRRERHRNAAHKNAREGHAPRRRSRDATSSGESRHPQLDERRYRLDSSIAGAEINKER